MFGLGSDESFRLLYLVLLLAFVAMGLRLSRGRIGSNVRHLGIWALIVLSLVAIYAYRGPLMRFAAPVMLELDPSRVVEVTDPDGGSELMVARAGDGHFYVDGRANGTSVDFLVDTGASSTVLTLADAERAGIDITALSFTEPVRTANGVALYAEARLGSLEIGPWRLSDVPISVMPADALDTSLLGMSTIDRFSSWRVEGDRMVLTP
jgi:aspartyl protease family protein